MKQLDISRTKRIALIGMAIATGIAIYGIMDYQNNYAAATAGGVLFLGFLSIYFSKNK